MCLKESLAKELAGVKTPRFLNAASLPFFSPVAIYESTAAGALSVAAVSTNDNDDNDLALPSWWFLRYP